MPNLLELKTILCEFESYALAEMFLDEIKTSRLNGTLLAIPGKPVQIQIENRPLNFTSMVFMDTPDTQRWIENTHRKLSRVTYHRRKEATAEEYAELTPAMFEYFAQQAKNDLISELGLNETAEDHDKSSSTKQPKHQNKAKQVSTEQNGSDDSSHPSVTSDQNSAAQHNSPPTPAADLKADEPQTQPHTS